MIHTTYIFNDNSESITLHTDSYPPHTRGAKGNRPNLIIVTCNDEMPTIDAKLLHDSLCNNLAGLARGIVYKPLNFETYILGNIPYTFTCVVNN